MDVAVVGLQRETDSAGSRRVADPPQAGRGALVIGFAGDAAPAEVHGAGTVAAVLREDRAAEEVHELRTARLLRPLQEFDVVALVLRGGPGLVAAEVHAAAEHDLHFGITLFQVRDQRLIFRLRPVRETVFPAQFDAVASGAFRQFEELFEAVAGTLDVIDMQKNFHRSHSGLCFFDVKTYHAPRQKSRHEPVFFAAKSRASFLQSAPFALY